ncbi:hypothetical protein BN938_2453 [Mucinivorans hirudinis]|uniref:HEPN AbiU2-like domain-containing protein n=1 Tax=Mucinivorans hirudinis TaxID=1433126 RepID=A0A060RDV1_9BACT|nr:hypothetical protein BN938_2453 [Mucinivorans hirudinis]
MSPKLFDYKTDDSFEADLAKNLTAYKERFNKRFEVLESNILLISKVKNIAVDDGNIEMTTLWNAFGYINLLSYDLISVGYSMILENRPWQKVYFARQVALLLYEGKEDLPELLGKYFKTIFSSTPKADPWIEELKTHLSELNSFKSKNHEYLKKIRLNVSGHRDQNINNQLDVITSINPYDIKTLMFEFEEKLRKLLDHIQPVIVNSLTLKI